jgi:soluble lytic murein transglycosylase-like protein
MTGATLAIWLLMTPTPTFYGVQAWPQSYDALIAYHADANLVPRFLAHAIIREESHFDPMAQSYEWKYSKRLKRWVKTDKVLARGMAQVSANPEHEADHVRKAGMRLEDYDWRDPGDSLRVGMAYMGSLLLYFDGELRPAVSAYNCGRGRASAWWNDGRALPRETARYMKLVLGGR